MIKNDVFCSTHVKSIYTKRALKIGVEKSGMAENRPPITGTTTNFNFRHPKHPPHPTNRRQVPQPADPKICPNADALACRMGE